MRPRSVALPVVALLALLTAAAPPHAVAAVNPQVPLDSHQIPQFVQALPTLDIAGGTIQTVDGTKPATIRMCEFDSNVLPPDALGAGTGQVATRTWGYVAGACPTTTRDTYFGPVVLAKRGTASTIRWVNDLGSAATTKVLAYKYSTDQTIFWADPQMAEMNMCDKPGIPAPGSDCAQNYAGSIPAVVHLHGGEVPPESDGGPDGWFTSDGTTGPSYYSRDAAGNSSVLTYPNTQEAAPLWFHDHVMGATRLDVYAGLAGAYLLADDRLKLPNGLAEYGLTNHNRFEPSIPLVIQDRAFDTNGQLYFPAGTSGGAVNSPNPNHPYWVPEFIGDTVVVNGKAWPYLNVEPKRYRFLLVDGSNARGYALSLVDPVSGNPGPAIYVIANDGGYLDKPVRIDGTAELPNQLFMLPGERYEVIVDFSGFEAGRRGPNGTQYSGHWLLQNTSPAPYPSGDEVDPATTGRVMQFNVGACSGHDCGHADNSFDPAKGQWIRGPQDRVVRLASGASLAHGVVPAKVRSLTLNEVELEETTAIDPVSGQSTTYDGGPLEVMLNNSPYDGGLDMANCKRTDFAPVTIGGMTTCVSEMPREGTTEVWEIVNTTMDAHPIHLHLVQFQLLNRQAFDVDSYLTAYGAAFPAGQFTPEYGPPLAYTPSAASGGKYGGNPDVTPYLQGAPQAAYAAESGWKDTVVAPPGTVTRLVIRWAPTDLSVKAKASTLAFPFDPSGGGNRGYVWHCHIIDHEDNEMMRPYQVELNPFAPAATYRRLVAGRDY